MTDLGQPKSPVRRIGLKMGILTFVSEVIKSIAWPVAAIVLAAIFRRPVSQLLSRLETAEAAGIKLGLHQAEQHADQADLPPAPAQAIVKPGQTPEMVIFDAWKDLEQYLNELIEHSRGQAPKKYSDLREFLYVLERTGKIPHESIRVFNNLRSVRNQVVHGIKKGSPPITDTEAQEFATLASRLIEQIRQAEA